MEPTNTETTQEKKVCKYCKLGRSEKQYYHNDRLPDYICKPCIKEIGVDEVKKSFKEHKREARRKEHQEIKRREKVKKQYHRDKIKKQRIYNKEKAAKVARLKYNTNPEEREKVKQRIKTFRNKYPEKKEAWDAIARLPRHKGTHLHHWSYNPEHHLDVILMRKQDHYKIHKFIKYDREAKMYKDKASGFLLNTKSLHAAFISLILETY